MVELIKLLVSDPRLGLIAFLALCVVYLWREQGKIKVEIKSVEKFLDKKKLDKEDFTIYSKGHSAEHKGIMAHLQTAIDLLKERLK